MTQHHRFTRRLAKTLLVLAAIGQALPSPALASRKSGLSPATHFAVPDDSLSDSEFRALAKALGLATSIEFWLSESRPKTQAESENQRLFSERLVQAQAAWIANASTADEPLRRLWDLRHQADWTREERLALIATALKLAKNDDAAILQELSDFTAAEPIEPQSKPVFLQMGIAPQKIDAWLAGRAARAATYGAVSFSELPPDITTVLVNGVLFQRGVFGSMNLPAREMRLTFLSNRLQPYSLRIKPNEIPNLDGLRAPWIEGLCRTGARPRAGAAQGGSITVLGADLCRKKLGADRDDLNGDGTQGIAAARRSATELDSFGLASRGDDLFSESKTAAPVYTKLWFWGVVAAVAAGAALAIAHQQKQTVNSTPVHRDGW